MKIGQVYDLKSFAAFLDSGKAPGFADSYAGVVLARNLTAVDPKIFEKKYPELTFINSGIDADNTGGYARRIQSLRVRELGGFANAGDTAGNKGKISLTGEDNTIPVIVREAHSEWSEDEIKEAELQNINLVSQYVAAHNRIYMREIDSIGFLGIAGKSTGLLTYGGFNSGGGTGAIAGLTAKQMYDDFADLITTQWNGVNNTPEYKANRVVTPVYVINTLTATMMDTTAGPASVMNALKANFPGVEFFGTHRADDAGGAGVSHTVAYSNNPDAMKMRIPVPLKISEIVKVSGFDFRVDSKYRVAGLDVLEDTAGEILTGL